MLGRANRRARSRQWLTCRPYADSRHRRRRLHRLEPRGRPASRGATRSTVIDDLSTGRRENLERRAGGRGRAGRARHPRRRGASPTLFERVEPRGDLPPRRPDRRAQVGRPTRRSTSRVNVEGTINVLERRARGRRAARDQHLHRRRDLRRGPDPPGARGPPGRRPRRPTACRSSAPRTTATCSPASTASRRSRCATATSTARARTRSARPGVIAIFCGKLLDGGRPDDLRRRPADARLRVRRRRGGRQPARGRVRRDRRVQHRPRRADQRARHRRGAGGRSRATASRPTTRRSARARCSTSRSTPRARGPSSAGSPGRSRPRPRADARLAALSLPLRADSGLAPRGGESPRRPATVATCTERTLLAPGEGETIRPGFEIKVGRPELVLTEALYAVGAAGPDPHVHHDHVDSFWVLEGQLGGESAPTSSRSRAPPGASRLVPPDVLHTFHNPGPGQARFLNMHAPGLGFEELPAQRLPGTLRPALPAGRERAAAAPA